MKAPAFQWYAADYLADERVIQLSLEAEGAYVRLLSYCWREGSIPANPALCAPMCKYADVKIIKTALALFTRSPTQSGRLIHKRLEEERAKQEAFKVKQAENGKMGGRPRKPTAKPDETQTKGLGYFGETQTEPKKRSISSTSSSMLTDVSKQAGEPAPKPQPVERRLPLPAEDVPLFKAEDWPSLNDPRKFAALCTNLDFPQVDFERYRKQIIVSLEGKELQATSLRNWVKSYLNNDKDEGALLVPMAQTPNERPSNHKGPEPFVPQPGSRIPDMSSVINPNWKPPQG